MAHDLLCQIVPFCVTWNSHPSKMSQHTKSHTLWAALHVCLSICGQSLVLYLILHSQPESVPVWGEARPGVTAWMRASTVDSDVWRLGPRWVALSGEGVACWRKPATGGRLWESENSEHPQWALSASCFWFKMWALGLLLPTFYDIPDSYSL